MRFVITKVSQEKRVGGAVFYEVAVLGEMVRLRFCVPDGPLTREEFRSICEKGYREATGVGLDSIFRVGEEF